MVELSVARSYIYSIHVDVLNGESIIMLNYDSIMSGFIYLWLRFLFTRNKRDCSPDIRYRDAFSIIRHWPWKRTPILFQFLCKFLKKPYGADKQKNAWDIGNFRAISRRVTQSKTTGGKLFFVKWFQWHNFQTTNWNEIHHFLFDAKIRSFCDPIWRERLADTSADNFATVINDHVKYFHLIMVVAYGLK